MSLVACDQQNTELTDELFEYLRQHHARSFVGIQEARSHCPERFGKISERFLQWLVAVQGRSALTSVADTFVEFTTDLIVAQARYERSGSYVEQSYDDVYETHYANDDAMEGYLWGLYVANFLWQHHFAVCLFFEDRLLKQLPDGVSIVELAPGHGGWGTWALQAIPESMLTGYDISPQAIRVATAVSAAAGFADRAKFLERDALDVPDSLRGSTDVVLSNCFAEHLAEPDRLFQATYDLLRPQGLAFITVALTAAQVDHVYEFRRESEVVTMCESNGLRVLDMLSSGPQRTLPKAQFLPRTVAVVVQKRTNDIF